MNWEIIQIQPILEYLLLPEHADKIMNSIHKPEIIIIKTRESIKLIKIKPIDIPQNDFFWSCYINILLVNKYIIQ